MSLPSVGDDPTLPRAVALGSGVWPALYGVPFGRYAKYYYVDPTNGDDSFNGLSLEAPMKTLVAAEDKLVANQHDTIFYIAPSSATPSADYDIEATLTWDKNLTHVFGVGAPTMVGQRSRIFVKPGDLGISPVIDVTASGCSFHNLYIFHGVASATSLINVRVTGSRNFFNRVHFAGGGHATQAVDGGASLNIAGGMENTFQDCTVGVDTIPAATGMVALLLSGTGAGRNIFRGSHFTLKAGAAGAAFIELSAISSIDRYTIFVDCLFINLAAQQMTEAIVCPAGFDPNDKRLIFVRSPFIGAPAWDISNRNVAVGDMGTPTGLDASGLMLTLEG